MSDLSNNSNLQGEQAKNDMCVSCRQFWGNPSQESLCSKCYRDKYKTGLPTNKTNEQSNNSNSKNTTNNATKDEKMTIEETKVNEVKPTEPAKALQTDTTRCWKCSKKIGLLGFKCKCNYLYCKVHRLPEEHECTIDFAKIGKERLAKENVALKADKLEKM